MLMTTVNETMWDLTQTSCILESPPVGEEFMPDTIIFQFYSDTNLNNAFDELSGMSLEAVVKEGTTLHVSRYDMDAMGDSIEAIVAGNGGEAI